MSRALILLLVLLVTLSSAAPAFAALSARDLAQAVARPPASARLPAGLAFTDQAGRPTTLGRVADGRPLVLLFADYTCRHICGPGAAMTAAALHGSGLVAGRDYALAIVGLDPHDGLDKARAFAAHLTNPDVARAARLLVGSPASVAAATRALGYGTAYDADTDQFAHDASVYVFARDGRLVTLLPELALRPDAVKAAIGGASPAPSLGERIAHLCYGLNAESGRYGRPIALALQTLAALTVAAAALFVWRRRRA